MYHFTVISVNIILLCWIQEEFDTYDHNAHLFVKLQFLKKRSKIIEIVAAKDIIFALAHSGLCAAFSRGRDSSYENEVSIGKSVIYVLLSLALYLCLQLQISDILPEFKPR